MHKKDNGSSDDTGKPTNVNREAKASEPTRLIDAPPASVPLPPVAPPPAARTAPQPGSADVIQGQNKIGVQEHTRFIGAYAREASAGADLRAGTAAPATAPGLPFDPVVGWLVVIAGPGRGRFRPVFEGSNPMGRNSRQRIPLDFGDDSISAEEQAYVLYDAKERDFLLVPNLARSNLVSLNGSRVTGATPLKAGDVISVGRTKLHFQPLCGPGFDWSDEAMPA